MSTDASDYGIVFPPMSAVTFPEMGPLRSFGGQTRALEASEHASLRAPMYQSVSGAAHQYTSIRAARGGQTGRSVDRVG